MSLAQTTRSASNLRHRIIAMAAAAVALTGLAACAPTAGVGAAGDTGFIPGGEYVLVGIGGGTVPQRNVTLLVEAKRLSGTGPCSAYSAQNTASLPAVALAPIQSARTSCSQSTLENRYFGTLQAATEAEFYGDVLKIKSPQTWLIYERGRPLSEATNALEAARASQ